MSLYWPPSSLVGLVEKIKEKRNYAVVPGVTRLGILGACVLCAGKDWRRDCVPFPSPWHGGPQCQAQCWPSERVFELGGPPQYSEGLSLVNFIWAFKPWLHENALAIEVVCSCFLKIMSTVFSNPLRIKSCVRPFTFSVCFPSCKSENYITLATRKLWNFQL